MIYRLTYTIDNVLYTRQYSSWNKRSVAIRRLALRGVKKITATMRGGYLPVDVVA